MLCCYLGGEFTFIVRNKRIMIGFALTEMQLLNVEVDHMHMYGYHSARKSLGCMPVLPSKKVEWSRYRPGVAQRVGRGIALLFHDRGTRRGWVVSSKPWPHFTPGKDPVPIFQEAGWAPRPIWTGGKSHPHWDSIPDRPACSQSLYRLSYPAQCCQVHEILITWHVNYNDSIFWVWVFDSTI